LGITLFSELMVPSRSFSKTVTMGALPAGDPPFTRFDNCSHQQYYGSAFGGRTDFSKFFAGGYTAVIDK
jgi:hypothetical protein